MNDLVKALLEVSYEASHEGQLPQHFEIRIPKPFGDLYNGDLYVDRWSDYIEKKNAANKLPF